MSTRSLRLAIHSPAISVSGHCIPVYPRLYLSTDSRPGFVQAARDLNAEMPSIMVSRLKKTFGPLAHKTVLILGIAYRAGVKEDAFSRVHTLDRELKRLGATPQAADPYYSDEEIVSLGLSPCADFGSVEAIILHTDHPEFRKYSAGDFPRLKCIVDGRNFLEPTDWGGATFISLGKP